MSGYYAAVKYPVDATRAQKIRALEEGIEDCALLLYEEFGVHFAGVEDALMSAIWVVEALDQEREATT